MSFYKGVKMMSEEEIEMMMVSKGYGSAYWNVNNMANVLESLHKEMVEKMSKKEIEGKESLTECEQKMFQCAFDYLFAYKAVLMGIASSTHKEE